MFRYVGVIWNDRDEADAKRAASLLERLLEVSGDLRVSFECPGMKVLSTNQQRLPTGCCHLWGKSGIVLGTLFSAPEVGEEAFSTRLTALEPQATRRVVDSGGQDLIDKYWGRYVAFISDPGRDTKVIMRDPMGGLPCFVTKFHGITVTFSCLEDCLRTRMFHFTLNWRHVAARVALSSWEVHEAGLEECMELRSGHSLRVSSAGAFQTSLWPPLAMAAREPLDDFDVAARYLRAMVQSCTNSWASCYDNLLTDISGGLDSAIVAACLARTPSRPKVTAVKFFNAETQIGETQRARLVAHRMGYEFVEMELQPEPIAIDRLLMADRTAKVELDVGVCEAFDAKRRLAHERGAIGIFNGDPGDVLFGASTKQFGVIDYVYRHGLDKRALKIALDVALMTDRSWWNVVAEALRRPKPVTTDLPAAILAHRHLLGDRARQIINQNPDLYSPTTPLAPSVPGMRDFLAVFAKGAQYYDYFESASKNNNDPEPVSILRSQPIVELCLRMPTYVKNAGGRERSIARHAFMHDIPTEITSTLWKDPAPNIGHARLLRSMTSIREFLVDGMLVNEQLLDAHKLRDALTLGPVRRASYPSELHDHLIAELWTRRISDALKDGPRSTTRPVVAHA